MQLKYKYFKFFRHNRSIKFKIKIFASIKSGSFISFQKTIILFQNSNVQIRLKRPD